MKDTVSPIFWLCSCGAEFESGRLAFLHRDGSTQHQIKPVTLDSIRPTGIEKEFTDEEDFEGCR